MKIPRLWFTLIQHSSFWPEEKILWVGVQKKCVMWEKTMMVRITVCKNVVGWVMRSFCATFTQFSIMLSWVQSFKIWLSRELGLLLTKWLQSFCNWKNMASKRWFHLMIFPQKFIWIVGCYGSSTVKNMKKRENAYIRIPT